MYLSGIISIVIVSAVKTIDSDTKFQYVYNPKVRNVVATDTNLQNSINYIQNTK